MSSGDEQVLGAILYSADSPDYTPRSVVFTDRQVLKIPLSKMSELVNRASGVPMVAAWLFEAANPAVFSGLGGMVGMKMWSNLKKQVAGKPMVRMERAPLPQELLAAAKAKLPYSEIKEAKLKKVMMSSDWLLSLSAGFLHSEKIVVDGSAANDVKSLVMATPLAQKFKE